MRRVRRRASVIAWIAVAAMLSACGDHSVAPTARGGRCVATGDPQQLLLSVVVPAGRPTRIAIETDGLLVAARLRAADGAGATAPWHGALERFDRIVLLVPPTPSGSIDIEIASRDGAQWLGQACLDVRALDARDARERTIVHAESLAAAAARAVAARRWNDAHAAFAEAGRLYDASGRSRDGAFARASAAELSYARLGRELDAYALATEALRRLPSQETSSLRARLLVLQGKSLLELSEGDGGVALRLFARARALLLPQAHGEREIARVDLLEGYAEFSRGRTEQSVGLFESVDERCASLRDWPCVGRARSNLAMLAQERSDYGTAATLVRGAIESLDAEREPESVAIALDNLAVLQNRLGLIADAERSLLRAHGLYRSLDDCDGARRALSKLGASSLQSGSTIDARTYLTRAASTDCARVLSSPEGPTEPTVAARDTSGVCDARDASAASIDARQAIANALRDLGTLNLRGGDLEAAERCAARARDLTSLPRTRLRAEMVLADIRLAEKRPAELALHLEAATQLADRAGIMAGAEQRSAISLGQAQAALLRGQASAGLRLSIDGATSASHRGDVVGVIAALRIAAGAAGALARADLAARALDTAADLAEHVTVAGLDPERRAAYLATQYAVFASRFELQAARAGASDDEPRPDGWQLLSASERGRMRALRTTVVAESSAAAAESGASAAQLMRAPANAGSARGGNALERLDSLLALFAAAARADSPGASQTTKQKPIDPAGLAEALPIELRRDDSALVSYVAGEQRYWALVSEGAEPRLVALGSRSRIDALALQLMSLLRDSAPSAEIAGASRALAREILWPLTPTITRKRLLLVPDGELHFVPFALLPWDGSDASPLLIERVEPIVAPSTAFVIARASATTTLRPSAVRVAVLADPVYRLDDWRRECVAAPASTTDVKRSATSWTEWLPRLPGSRDEALDIAAVLQRSRPQARLDLRLGCDATTDSFDAGLQTSDLLHVASHGRVDAERPRLSGLALSPRAPGQAPGIVDLVRIASMRTHARLVVLSACDTSRGRLLPGEGVLSPAQAFLQAGASGVISSYWRVGDRATAAFMGQFYRRMLQHGEGPSAALRYTQLEAIRAGVASQSWAAFAYFGARDVRL